MNNLNILAMKKSLLLLVVVVAVVAYTETHAQGTLWGSTLEGGPGNTGVMFRVGADGTGLVVERNFEIAALGQIPGSTLVEAANKKLYGVTQQGGISDKGVLFEYDPVTGTYTKKIDFNGVGNGGYVRGGLTIGNNNKLYGITVVGGSSDFGVLFEYDFVTGILTKKIDFNGTANGSYPYGSLTMGSNNKLYGMTSEGGISNFGVLFEYDPATSTLTKKIDFSGAADGRFPNGSLTLGSNNKLYGVTVLGGASNFGVLFEYDPATGTLTKKIDFNGTVIGRLPYEGLTLGSNGKFYGTTLLGGASNKGVLFEYESATNNLTKKFDFDPSENGGVPYGKLTESSNKKLYGMTEQGGTAGKGILFEYDQATGILTKKSDFDGSKGSKPQGSLLFVCLKPVKPTIALSNGNTELPTLTSSATAGNQWFLNGTAIAGAVNATLNITTVGVYKVQVTLDGCVSDFSDDQPIIVTGDLTTTNPFVEIFPNPVYEWLTVRFGKTAGMKSVALYQLNGVQTDMQETSSDEAKFHIANYGAGVYLVKVKAEGSLKVMRFIKK
jgi:uncharacterized repeat protein (TIGR03803 family)